MICVVPAIHTNIERTHVHMSSANDQEYGGVDGFRVKSSRPFVHFANGNMDPLSHLVRGSGGGAADERCLANYS
jgi:hypothetical protein